MNRRHLLGGLGAATAGLALGGPARAAGEAANRKFVFVQALGGWDVTRVFAPIFGSPDVHMEAGAEPVTIGDLSYVAHPERPWVDQFFAQHVGKTALMHGLYVASVAHPSAIRLLLTGSLDATYADWATRIGAASSEDPVLPHLVVGGLYYAGSQGVHVGRAGTRGQLQGLSSGNIVTLSDQEVARPDPRRSAEVDPGSRAPSIGPPPPPPAPLAPTSSTPSIRPSTAPPASRAWRASSTSPAARASLSRSRSRSTPSPAACPAA